MLSSSEDLCVLPQYRWRFQADHHQPVGALALRNMDPRGPVGKSVIYGTR